MSTRTESMIKARHAQLSNEERKIEALEQIAEGVRGVQRELQKLSAALKADKVPG